MQKKKIFKIEDSNIEGIGTDADKECRKTAAATEKQWKKIKKGIPVWTAWRVEKFKVKPNMEALDGVLYDDDSYIFLKGYEQKETKKIKYDIHFWLGKTTSQDEAGTAAYKTVELDSFLNDEPIQHRECSGNESQLFISYFPKGVRLLSGGVESGFNHVKPETWEPRLLHIKGKKNVRTVQIDIKISSLNSGDVFVLDAGLILYQYQGRKAGKFEKVEGGRLLQAIDDERKGKPSKEVFSQIDKIGDTMRRFFSYFESDLKECRKEEEVKAGEPVSEKLAKIMCDRIPTSEGEDDATYEKKSDKMLLQLSDADGKLQFKEVGKGKKCTKDLLKSDDVFIFDIGCEVYVWIGKGASEEERKQAMSYASKYLKDYDRPMQMPVTAIYEGGENEIFENAFHGK